eukprot:10133480-Alexandrium_andersonii.AAC.1
MSASLVGSEMCIRDRSKRSSREPNRAIQGPPIALPSTVPTRTTRQGAVSYTHLTLPTICSV